MKSQAEHSFTSTGLKLLHHGLVTRPIVTSIALTSRCNLKCEYCSVANRDQVQELSMGEIGVYLDQLPDLKSVVLTGGGEPCMHPHVNSILFEIFRKSRGLEVGLITNGTMCHLVDEEFWPRFSWVRASWNSHAMDVPHNLISGTFGLSVVDPDCETMEEVEDFARKSGAEYVRAVPDCRPGKTSDCHVDFPSDLWFWQWKNPRNPNTPICHQAFFKPYLHESGWVYPCDSVTLHDDEQSFDVKKYGLCRYDHIAMWMLEGKFPFDPRVVCSRCVFADTVEMIEAARKVKHVNFL